VVGECAGIPVLAKLSQLMLGYLVPLVMYKTSNGRIDTGRKISFKTD